MDLRTSLPSVLGAKTATLLAEHLRLQTVGDLLHHYPRRYAARGELMDFDELVEGEHATVVAEVRSVRGRQIRDRLHKTDVVIGDGRGATMTLALFNRRWLERDLPPGTQAFFSGKVERFHGALQLGNPEVQKLEAPGADEFAGTIVPIYPASAKTPSEAVRRSVATVLAGVDVGADPLPPDVRDAHALPGLERALRMVHQPREEADWRTARRRLRWDEAFVLQVVLAQRRAALRQTPAVARPRRAGGVRDALDAALPFTLTQGQREVGELLDQELARSTPMNRLLQGEVGSGKTLVALRAALAVVDAGGQAALLAPTEVLAAQHARSLRALLGPLARAGELEGAPVATRVALLTGSLPAAARRAALAQAAGGQAGIVVGTHALLSEGVAFADLGLVVVDEQHRFGVEQRDALRAKGTAPHVLVMTATPIPRTVAMTVFGDLEVSTLAQLPAGRSPIGTHVVPGGGRPLERTWEKVREEVAAGHRAFVVCPRIGAASGEEDGPEQDDGRAPAAAVELVAPLLTAGPLAGLRVGVLHGRLSAEDKDAAMAAFGGGDLDVLVATTVIEVGVDVPEATVMVVLDADRFGVSQLHQLRGRVGRGSAPGLCVLVTSVDAESPAGQRLRAVASTTDGFRLSELDLQLRREGDVLGTGQSGRTSLRLLRLRDRDVIAEARTQAQRLVQADPGLARHPALAAAVGSIVDEDRAGFLDKA